MKMFYWMFGSRSSEMRRDSEMKLLFLLILFPSMRFSIAQLSNEDATVETVPDPEQELSAELQQIEIRSTSKWSQWSEWSSCSRSCDGGVAHQLRRCQGVKCRGEHIRHKICNMQGCPESRDFRQEQCSAFDRIPYEGSMLQWTPHYDEEAPCTLTCKGRPVNSNEISDEENVQIVARLGDKVYDGTRCRSGSLDMCIDGKCQMVGCDLKIGSTKQVDSCGVCGGDGSSCSRPLYHWNLKSLSLCSATCGGGYKMSRPVCQNILTDAEVEEQLCNLSQKPDATVVECNIHSCPPKWHTTEWSSCSVTCGGGSRLRQVYCVEEMNGTKIRINELKCNGRKPRFQEPCNQMVCPKWHTSPWSGCSTSCGKGLQIRTVECRNSDELPSTLCSEKNKPSTSKTCATGIPCPQEYDNVDELLPGLYHTQPLMQPYPPPPPAHAERLVREQVVPSESTFIPDEWGPCSVTCGEGVRKREVHCKIFLEFSRTIAKLPDKQCSGPKPIETERCFMEPCSAERVEIKDDPFRSEIRVGSGSPTTTYSWREQGYTHCSASCLGGVQELIVNCLRDDTQKVTSPYMCARELKPEVLIRTCNDHPCPPRWNYSDFHQCSQSCGIGIQTREVNCIHEVTQGGGNTVVVPNNMCPQPPPPDRQYCNVLDCPVRWMLSEWSRCTKPCGNGEKIRQVECKQVMAQNHTVDRPASMCPSPKPLDKKPCNTKSCILETDKPQIETSNSTFIQHNPKKKKISVKVGGAATVFYGSTLKIKCPVKRFNRTKIQWAKDHTYLSKSKKVKISKKGALRILNLTYRDSGVYTCVAGRSSADFTLSVKPRPGEFPTSEEIQRQGGFKTEQRVGYDIGDVQARDDVNPVFGNDDQSHEQRKDFPKKTTNRPKIIYPTPPPFKSDDVNVNSLNAYPPQSTTLVSDQDDTFSNSRGHRMVTYPSLETTTHLINLATTLHEDTTIIPLVEFEWSVTEWSRCSQHGGAAYQIRTVYCIRTLLNYTETVENNFCKDAEIPSTIRKCESGDLPKWNTSEWTPCEDSKCITWNTAIQRRGIACLAFDNSTIKNSECDETLKPHHKKECYNGKCRGVWKVGPWSGCVATCETPGVKYRILQCVWYGTKRPAGTACRDQPRPPVMKSCKGSPCIAQDEECKDHSMFCTNVKAMNLCRIMRYQQQCCHTCTSD